MAGYIVYQGPSLIDGGPIFAVALTETKNAHTGALVQTYIMRSDQSPMLASKRGTDASNCGTCPLRGEATEDPARKTAKGRLCNIQLYQAPEAIYRAYKRGLYPVVPPDQLGRIRGFLDVRIGNYGDGSAVPLEVWRALVGDGSHTAYSHQWSSRPDLVAPGFYMASVETKEDAQRARGMGYTPYRILKSLDDLDNATEVLCPKTPEGGASTDCARCMRCHGTSYRKNGERILGKGIASVASGSFATSEARAYRKKLKKDQLLQIAV